jgi:hypothetical protein
MYDNLSHKDVRGRIRLYQVIDDPRRMWVPPGQEAQLRGKELWVPQTDWQDNLVTYQWGAIVAQLLSQGSINYRLSGMYLEFVSAGTPTVPPVSRTRAQSYYGGLAGGYDYLRVPLRSAMVGNTNPSLYPLGNSVVFSAKTFGVTGVNGQAFQTGSTVYAAALAAYVAANDPTQDLIFSAVDFTTQQTKLSTSQIGVDWEIDFI